MQYSTDRSESVEPETADKLRKEYRFNYFQPIELEDRHARELLYFHTGKAIFYGYQIETVKTLHDSEVNSRQVIKGYIGISIFINGEIYIGEFNDDFQPHGEGLFFFPVGAILRGNFERGKAHGALLVSLPLDCEIMMNMSHGVLSKAVKKLNYSEMKIQNLKYTQGTYIKEEESETLDERSLEKIKDELGILIPPDLISKFKKKNKIYFGTFLDKERSLYYGFVKEGKMFGWGVSICLDRLNESVHSLSNHSEFSWRLVNQDGECVAIGMNQDKDMVYGLEKEGSIQGEMGIYHPLQNCFQKAVLNKNHIELDNMFQEGINFQFIQELFNKYIKDNNIPLRKELMYRFVFDLQHFTDVFFFYLHGKLKKQVTEFYTDKFGILRKSFFKDAVMDKFESNEKFSHLNDSIGNGIGLKGNFNMKEGVMYDITANKESLSNTVRSEVNKKKPFSIGKNIGSYEKDYVADKKFSGPLEHLNILTGTPAIDFKKKKNYGIEALIEDKRDEKLIVIEEANEEVRRSQKSENKFSSENLHKSSRKSNTIVNPVSIKNSSKNSLEKVNIDFEFEKPRTTVVNKAQLTFEKKISSGMLLKSDKQGESVYQQSENNEVVLDKEKSADIDDDIENLKEGDEYMIEIDEDETNYDTTIEDSQINKNELLLSFHRKLEFLLGPKDMIGIYDKNPKLFNFINKYKQ